MVSVRKAEARQNAKLSHVPVWPLFAFIAVMVAVFWFVSR
jgi:type VI protein secretion system component VasF